MVKLLKVPRKNKEDGTVCYHDSHRQDSDPRPQPYSFHLRD